MSAKNELNEILNTFRDTKHVEAEKKQEELKKIEKENRQRKFQESVQPIFDFMIRDKLLAEDVGKNIAKENAVEQVRSKELQIRTEKLQEQAKQLLLESHEQQLDKNE